MLGFLDFIVSLTDLVSYWRVLVGVILTAAVFCLAVSLTPEATEWFVAVPIGLAGVFLSFRWQSRSE